MNVASCVLPANAGVGVGALLGGAFVLFLIPITLLESVVLRLMLGCPSRRSLKLSLIANLLSTIAGLLFGLVPLDDVVLIVSCYCVTVAVEAAYLRRALGNPGTRRILGATLLMNLVTYLLLVPFLVPAPNMRIQEIMCKSNLRQIGHALLVYREDLGGHFRGDLSLLKEYFGTMYPSACPYAKRTGRSRHESEGSASDYEYVPPPTDLPQEDAATTPVAWDRPGNHRASGNVLYADLTVVTLRGEEWQELVHRLTKELEQSRLSP